MPSHRTGPRRSAPTSGPSRRTAAAMRRQPQKRRPSQCRRSDPTNPGYPLRSTSARGYFDRDFPAVTPKLQKTNTLSLKKKLTNSVSNAIWALVRVLNGDPGYLWASPKLRSRPKTRAQRPHRNDSRFRTIGRHGSPLGAFSASNFDLRHGLAQVRNPPWRNLYAAALSSPAFAADTLPPIPRAAARKTSSSALYLRLCRCAVIGIAAPGPI